MTFEELLKMRQEMLRNEAERRRRMKGFGPQPVPIFIATRSISISARKRLNTFLICIKSIQNYLPNQISGCNCDLI